MGNDARLREIFEADDLVNKDGTTDGYAWCCAFVSVCIQRLFAMSPMFPTVSAPRVASVHLFRARWAPEQGCLIFPPSAPHAPHKGDVVVFHVLSYWHRREHRAPARFKRSKETPTSREAERAPRAGESNAASDRSGASSACPWWVISAE